MDFTVTKWNTLIDMLESLHTVVIGRGVCSGLDLSAGTGLSLNISDGVLNSRSVVSLSNIGKFTCPASATSYVWISETGVVSTTTTPTYPGGNVVCLGKVVTSGSAITSVSEEGRQNINMTLQKSTQTGGYSTVPLSSTNVTLVKEQYQSRVVVFTGTLTNSVSVIVPNVVGSEWTFIDSTTGAFTVTVKTATGSGITLTHNKTCKLWTNGVDVLRVTPNV
jgi:hypothetical protein